MKAVILAGGKGTRLSGIAKDIPKSMVKIGQKPLLEHQITILKREGIKDIILCLGHLSGIIKDYFGDGSRFGVKIAYSVEEKPLGTAGCIKEIEKRLKDDFIVIYGDVMFDIDIKSLIRFHKSKKGAATLVLHPNDHPADSDLLDVDEKGRITALSPKPHDENRNYRNLVSAAFYILSPTVLRYIKKGKKSDFCKDIFPKMLDKGERLYGYATAEYLKDMGTPERHGKVNHDFVSGKIGRLNRKNKRRCIFVDRDGVINEEVNFLHKQEQFKLLPGVVEAIKKANASEYLIVVITNQPVVARNLCSEEELREIHKKMETLLGKEGAYLNAVYYCPHHPDKGHPGENPAYKIVCECRKPGTGLIKKAAEEFNIDLGHSYFIGDTTRDVLTGMNAGTRTILLKTGYGGKDGKYSAKPDYTFDNLDKAVESILKMG